jgi:hypothetical protein
MLESVPRPADLTEADQTPIGPNQHALCFRSVPGKQYGIQWAETVGGYDTSGWAYDVAVSGHNAYVANTLLGTGPVELTEPEANPRQFYRATAR